MASPPWLFPCLLNPIATSTGISPAQATPTLISLPLWPGCFAGLTGLLLWTALLIQRPPAHLHPAILQQEQPRRQLETLRASEPSQDCLILGPVWLPDQKLLFTATWAGSRGQYLPLTSAASRGDTGVLQRLHHHSRLRLPAQARCTFCAMDPRRRASAFVWRGCPVARG